MDGDILSILFDNIQSIGGLMLAVLILGLIGYFLGVTRARAVRARGPLHSLPSYHGAFVLVWTILPAFLVLAVWAAVQPGLVRSAALAEFPQEVLADQTRTDLEYNVVEQVRRGLQSLSEQQDAQVRYGLREIRGALEEQGSVLASELTDYMVDAGYAARAEDDSLSFWRTVVILAIATIGLLGAYFGISPRRRARNAVETVIKGLLIAASAVAILTTFGIVFSMIFESLRFFEAIPPANFFFGTVWDPGFESAGALGGDATGFGLLPLLWGTLYISFIALLIAVPVGLFSAIYMSEFAPPTFRAIAKPLLEILAGIPTIVYGFFALITVGPAIADFFQSVFGMTVSASSVATAGIVMGIMIIPFVSSLSDDIINAVPQSLRDGSYGLGATKAETVQNVILPAALPGIVGAVLLAASRAIGETMIVVLAAGATAKISANPLEDMTTITVKIVSQLTGDVDFTSPQALVAFALGITLFAITLVMNVMALRIVRKYREKYE
ncbi:MAG: phosphate ABC transporter permease subunit PstC [Pseudomonadota bacterium]